VAPDYILCHESKLKAVKDCLQQRLIAQFGSDQKDNSEFGRNVTSGHTQRLKDMIVEAEEAGCTVLSGGSKQIDVEQRYVPTTLLEVNAEKHSSLRILNEEIFGGILPIMSYTDTKAAIQYINDKPGTPLALYIFTTDGTLFEQYANTCPSGGLVRNDVLVHFATSSLPFGGLGTSGYGKAHGEHGFDTFAHHRAVLNKPCHWALEFGGLRYPPYTKFSCIGGSGKAFATLLGIGPTIPVVNWGKFREVLLLCGLLCCILYVGASVPGSEGFFSLTNLGTGLEKIGQWLKS